MKRALFTLLAAALLVAMAAPAMAHNIHVETPGGEVIHWVGGLNSAFTPAADAPPMFGPFNVPPSHGTGLVMACLHEQSPAMQFVAPGTLDPCRHGPDA